MEDVMNYYMHIETGAIYTRDEIIENATPQDSIDECWVPVMKKDGQWCEWEA